MIAAFPDRPSVVHGNMLRLYAAADRPVRAHLRFVRCGVHATEHGDRAAMVNVPPVLDDRAAATSDWPSFGVYIPEDWKPGVYIAIFDDGNEWRRRIDGRDARALFVVRSRQPQSPILYNIPLFTYHAYNVALSTGDEEATCLYNGAHAVTLSRPGGGVGGHTWDESILDVYDPGSPRQTFAHWDARAIAWLEDAGLEPDYCCDLDLHEDAELLSDYQLLLGFGHHEYWTDSMRSALQRHLRAGRNAAFFSGNTCWFRTHYDAPTRSISRIGRWIDDPEETTFGVSYRFGGGKWRGGRPPSAYIVTKPQHWAFTGVDIDHRRFFGADDRLLGYECDGAPPEPDTNFELLAEGSLRHWPVSDGSGELSGSAHASMGIFHHGGSLFTAGTVDWSRVLSRPEPLVARVTANVIRRLSQEK